MIVCVDFRHDDRVLSLVVDEGSHLSCGVCGKTSSSKKDLVRHIISKHVAAPAVFCQFCGKQYKNQNSLQVHISQNHRDQWKRGDQY